MTFKHVHIDVYAGMKRHVSKPAMFRRFVRSKRNQDYGRMAKIEFSFSNNA